MSTLNLCVKPFVQAVALAIRNFVGSWFFSPRLCGSGDRNRSLEKVVYVICLCSGKSHFFQLSRYIKNPRSDRNCIFTTQTSICCWFTLPPQKDLSIENSHEDRIAQKHTYIYIYTICIYEYHKWIKIWSWTVGQWDNMSVNIRHEIIFKLSHSNPTKVDGKQPRWGKLSSETTMFS